MKEIANVALGPSGETAQAPENVHSVEEGSWVHIGRKTPWMARFWARRVRLENERLTIRILMPLLLITIATVVWVTTSWGYGKQERATALPAFQITLMANVAGHEVTAAIDATAFIDDQSKEPCVEFLKHKLVIEKERLLLDGKERAKIPAEAKLQIIVSNTKLGVTANGEKAFRTTIRR